MIPFEFAAGSVPGVRHQRAGKNNQDAWTIQRGDDIAVAVVADGCGSALYSEIGARLGVKIAASTISRILPISGIDTALAAARAFITTTFRTMCMEMGGIWGEEVTPIVASHFLFTMVTAIFTPETVYIAAFGDGAVSVNGRYETWDYAENKPPYMAYDLVEPNNGLDWTVMLKEPTGNVETLMIGTDGVADLHGAAGKTMPGQRKRTVPSIDDLFTDNHVFSNEDGLRRYLALTAQDNVRLAKDGGLDKLGGLLGDDTTLILARRRVDG